MGLKQSIVIRSEYTNNARSSPGKGSRGASPGQYVMRYMAREDATEFLAPNPEIAGLYDGAGLLRYMARHEATEQLIAKQDDFLQDADAYGSPLVLKHRFKQIDKQSGRAFGSKGISLSHYELQRSSETIQNAFDNGHSVQKIIVSFTEDYLRESGVLNQKFKHKGRGSYKGKIDQLRLRQAITNGVNQMVKSGKFSHPEWVGTIQLDTSYVHAHIALVDTEFSPSRMRDDGADRGKINEREKKMFRKGVHFGLEDMRDLKSFHNQASTERQNVVAHVKNYAYSTLNENVPMQLLIASLPKDKKQWRYKTNRLSMKHSNQIAKEIVEGVFRNKPHSSGFKDALAAVNKYANESAKKNKLSQAEENLLINKGYDRIVERSVNGLYSSIKNFDPSVLRTRTPMTDVQSSSDEELANALNAKDTVEFDAAAFALRVRGYSKRREVHSKMARKHFEMASEFDVAKDRGYVDDSAHVMRLYYEEEQRYHMGLTDKYRCFMSFQSIEGRNAIQKMKPIFEELTNRFQFINAEEVAAGETLEDQRHEYKNDLRRYTFSCFEYGVASLKEWRLITDYHAESGKIETKFVLPVRPKATSENTSGQHFHDVKAWDVHHLGLDYYNHPDARIDSTNAHRFAEAWQARKQQVDAAKMYVTTTGQTLYELEQSDLDVNSMEGVVTKAVQDGLTQTVSLEDLSSINEGDRRQRYTIELSHSVDMTKQLRDTLTHIELMEDSEEELE